MTPPDVDRWVARLVVMHADCEYKARVHAGQVQGDAYAQQAPALDAAIRALRQGNSDSRRLDALQPAAAPQPITLEWSPTLCDGKRVSYADAEKACAALGEGWRLPTRMELESILDLTRHEPAIDTARFPDTKSGWYWTSTPCAWSPDFAWIVSFDYGYADDLLRDDYDAFVRAVRGVPAGQ